MIANIKPYPAMKDSGVPWLGEVPTHWINLPGRACYQEKKVSSTGLKETTVLSLSYGQIVVKPAEKLHGLVPASFDTYQIVESGDIIVRPTDLQNDWNSLRFGLSRHRGIITSAYICLHTKDVLSREYGHQLLHTYDLKKVFYGLGSGLRQNLDWRDFKYLPCLVPPLPEQAAIVRFLDYVDGRIRRYISAKQKLIKLLEEQKQAIIHRAVTRGLDLSIPLKPSGIPWLGDIPQHWEVRRTKTLSHIKTGGRDTVDRIDHALYPFFVRSQTVERIDTYSFDGEAVLTAGDGAGVAKVFHYVNGKFDYHQRVYKFSSFKHISGKFFFYYLSSTLRYEALDASAKSTVDSLRLPLLQNFPTVVPPSEEQEAIVRAIETETGGLDAVMSRVTREIELLREYRTRLVADVVTGKLDVREVAANLPEGIDTSDSINPDEVDDIEELEDESIDDIEGVIEEGEYAN